MKITIEKIRIMERIRKEINKIDELASDILQNGLVNPVTVMPLEGEEFRLLAGLRRIKAARMLGWAEIEASVVSPSDAESALRIEISENEQREPFTFSEKMDYARLIEEIELVKAKERKSAGGKGGLSEDVAQGPPLQKGKSRDIIGEKIGMSGRQYCRAKYITENASPEVIDQLDKGERTIRGTYDELLHVGEEAEKPETPNEPIPTEPVAEPKRKAEDKAEKTSIQNTPPSEPARTEPESKPERKAEAKPKTRGKKPVPSPDYDPTKTYRIPKQRPLSTQDLEADRKIKDFHALPPEGKIEELQRQLRVERARAAGAESALSSLKDQHHNAVYHKDSIIESLKWQLEAANNRVKELEDKYEPGQHTRTNLCLVRGGSV